jgi:hypothetical protein
MFATCLPERSLGSLGKKRVASWNPLGSAATTPKRRGWSRRMDRRNSIDREVTTVLCRPVCAVGAPAHGREVNMAYEAPTVSEVGSIESLTLGSWQPGPERDSFQWWIFKIPDPWGDPSSGS